MLRHRAAASLGGLDGEAAAAAGTVVGSVLTLLATAVVQVSACACAYGCASQPYRNTPLHAALSLLPIHLRPASASA